MIFAELSLGKLQLEGAQVPGGRSWDTCRVEARVVTSISQACWTKTLKDEMGEPQQ